MQYYRCKCGEHTAWGSMPPNRCFKCEKCGSDLAQAPGLHRDPVPHDFTSIENIKTDQGDMTITRCRYCHRTKAQIERVGT